MRDRHTSSYTREKDGYVKCTFAFRSRSIEQKDALASISCCISEICKQQKIAADFAFHFRDFFFLLSLNWLTIPDSMRFYIMSIWCVFREVRIFNERNRLWWTSVENFSWLSGSTWNFWGKTRLLHLKIYILQICMLLNYYNHCYFLSKLYSSHQLISF